MSEWKVPVQSLIDHIKSAVDVDQWAKDMAEELLKEQEPKIGTWQWKIHGKAESGGTLGEAICDQCGKSTYATAVKGDLNYCPNCGSAMMNRRQSWND